MKKYCNYKNQEVDLWDMCARKCEHCFHWSVDDNGGATMICSKERDEKTLKGIDKEKLNKLFQDIKNEVFYNSTDEEYNAFMGKIQELQREICK